MLKFTLPVNTALSADRRLSLDDPAELLTHLHSQADSTIGAEVCQVCIILTWSCGNPGSGLSGDAVPGFFKQGDQRGSARL